VSPHFDTEHPCWHPALAAMASTAGRWIDEGHAPGFPVFGVVCRLNGRRSFRRRPPINREPRNDKAVTP
jgi:hypothetical protein